jgi:hypothetical protein
MGEFADELQAGIEEAARNIVGALAAGDDYGVEVYWERLCALKRAARRHGIQLSLPAITGEPGTRSWASCTASETRHRGCDLRFGRMTMLGQDSGLCLFASCI